MRLRIALAVIVLAAPAAVLAKKKAAASESSGKRAAPNTKEVAALAGKFKWGMAPDDVLKVVGDQLQQKYTDLISKEQDIYKQDQLRKEQQDELQKVKDSLIRFDGQKTGWDVSIIDKEFSHHNDESMIVLWEKDQRRFLFFWHNRLYKQFIALNSDRFQGKSFDDFAQMIEKRFGPAEMKFANLRTKDEQALDHLEWAPAGDVMLWAIDQSQFYGNYCLVLKQASVVAQLQKIRNARASGPTSNALIDSVTTPEKVQGDPNADIVDSITGKKPSGEPTR